MRMLTLTAVGALLAGALAFSSADADEAPAYHLNDVAGDANAINGQGIFDEPNNQSTGPASYSPADLHGVRFETMSEDGEPTGLRLHIGLGGVPSATSVGQLGRILGSLDGCNFQIQWFAGSGTPLGTNWRVGDGCGVDTSGSAIGLVTINSDGFVAEPAEDGSGIVLEFPFDAAPALSKRLKLGAEFFGIESHTRVVIGVPGQTGITFPQLDEMIDPEFDSFVIGEDLD